MGQAPAHGRNSLRTMPRNFPGRSGTQEDSVYLCSPETAAAAVLTGTITDPRDLEELFNLGYPAPQLPAMSSVNLAMLERPLPAEVAAQVKLVNGDNISSLPVFTPLADRIEAPVILTLGDDISTDEILPAGARVLPYRSNIPKLAEFTFDQIDETYPTRAAETRAGSGHIVVAGPTTGKDPRENMPQLLPDSSDYARCWPCHLHASIGKTSPILACSHLSSRMRPITTASSGMMCWSWQASAKPSWPEPRLSSTIKLAMTAMHCGIGFRRGRSTCCSRAASSPGYKNEGPTRLASETEPGCQGACCARPGRSDIAENELLPQRTEPRQARNIS